MTNCNCNLYKMHLKKNTTVPYFHHYFLSLKFAQNWASEGMSEIPVSVAIDDITNTSQQ